MSSLAVVSTSSDFDLRHLARFTLIARFEWWESHHSFSLQDLVLMVRSENPDRCGGPALAASCSRRMWWIPLDKEAICEPFGWYHGTVWWFQNLQHSAAKCAFPHHVNCSRRGIDVFLRAFFACVLSFDEAVKSSMKPTVELVWRKSVQSDCPHQKQWILSYQRWPATFSWIGTLF